MNNPPKEKIITQLTKQQRTIDQHNGVKKREECSMKANKIYLMGISCGLR